MGAIPVRDLADGEDCEAGESDAKAAASVAARLACLALAANFGNEKSPKSESAIVKQNFFSYYSFPGLIRIG
jgi:hypothetical protein